jgi:hypothetical protein
VAGNSKARRSKSDLGLQLLVQGKSKALRVCTRIVYKIWGRSLKSSSAWRSKQFEFAYLREIGRQPKRTAVASSMSLLCHFRQTKVTLADRWK